MKYLGKCSWRNADADGALDTWSLGDCNSNATRQLQDCKKYSKKYDIVGQMLDFVV